MCQPKTYVKYHDNYDFQCNAISINKALDLIENRGRDRDKERERERGRKKNQYLKCISNRLSMTNLEQPSWKQNSPARETASMQKSSTFAPSLSLFTLLLMPPLSLFFA